MVSVKLYVIRCAMWYHLYNLKNVINAHGGVLLLVRLQALKVTLLRGCFSRSLNCTNGTKSCKTPIEKISNFYIEDISDS